jgi:V/A-type H+-transporting ATPase subunit I
MALVTTKTFSISLESESQAKELTKNLLTKGIKFEILDPSDLSSEWHNVHYLNSENQEFSSLELKQISEILNKIPKSGFIDNFIDKRAEGTMKDMLEAKENQNSLMKIVKTYTELKENKQKLKLIEESAIKNPDKNYLFGEDLGHFYNKITLFLDQIEKINNKIQPSENLNTEITFTNITDNLEAISFDKNLLPLIKEYVENEFTEEDPALHSPKDIINNLNLDILSSEDYLTENAFFDNNLIPSNEIYNKLAALHGYLELENKTGSQLSKFFKLKAEDTAIFSFISVIENQSEDLEKVFNDLNIPFEIVNWNQDIVDWQNRGGLKAFQSVAQSIGTIDRKESDPTKILAIFFMIFFAFCLNDAIYGLILASFTGYLLFFKKVKKEFYNIFSIFFYSGILTVLLGMLTNSWAGDLFNSNLTKGILGLENQLSTPINDVLKNFQLIDVLAADSDAPINIYLKENLGGLNPIVAMVLIAVSIGLLNTLSAYIFYIINSFKRGDRAAGIHQIAWIFFLFSAVLYLIFNSQNLNLLSQLIISLGLLSILFLNQASTFTGKILGFLFGPRGLYGLIQMGADLMSFTRIVAIGLTGGVIANIINLLAGIMYESAGPIFGLLLAIIVLLVGHTFNFVLSVFGAYINPIRLSYVEFMPKFFLGEGRQTKQTNLDLSYFKVVENPIA